MFQKTNIGLIFQHGFALSQESGISLFKQKLTIIYFWLKFAPHTLIFKQVRLAFLILSIIVLLDILAALSALLGLADFLDRADLLSKIVLKDEEKGKSPDEDREDNVSNRELLKTTIGEEDIEADSVSDGGPQSDLIYLMNTTDGELMDPRGEVAIFYDQKQKQKHG